MFGFPSSQCDWTALGKKYAPQLKCSGGTLSAEEMIRLREEEKKSGHAAGGVMPPPSSPR